MVVFMIKNKINSNMHNLQCNFDKLTYNKLVINEL